MIDPEESAAPTGPQEGRCGAIRHRNSKGEPDRWCRKYPMRGSNRCERDGAAAPQVRAAVERRRQEEAGRALVAKLGLPVHIEWHEALQGALNEAYGNLLFLRDQVGLLAPEALTWGESQVVEISASQFPGIDRTRTAATVPVVAMYERALDRVQKFALDAGKLGLEAHRQAWTERQSAPVADAIRGILTDLGHDVADPRVMQVVSTRLEALAGATA